MAMPSVLRITLRVKCRVTNLESINELELQENLLRTSTHNGNFHLNRTTPSSLANAPAQTHVHSTCNDATILPAYNPS